MAPRIAGLLILCGVLFRIWATGSARFTEEESLFWRTALDILEGRELPLYGPPLTGSTAHHPGPLFYYLMALPQALGPDPRFGGAFVAALHGLAGWMTYAVFVRASGPAAGLFGLVLWLFAPWDVLYADRIWLSCVAPVWGTATLYAAVRASESPVWQGVLLFLAIGAPQLHMSAPIVWAGAAAWLWLRPPARWSKVSLLIGVAAGALLYLPTLAFELRHELENTRLILAKSRGKAGPMTLVNSPLRVFGNAVLASTAEISYHFQRGYWHAFNERDTYILPSGWLRWLRFHGWWSPLMLTSLAVGFFGWGHTVRGLVRRARAARGSGRGARAWARALRGLEMQDHLTITLLVALGSATALLIVSRKGYYPHYSNLVVPLVLWPVARALAGMWRAGGRGRSIAGGLALASALTMGVNTVRYYRTVDALNGLETTEAMVAAALAEGAPIALEFAGFDNTAAWKNLAEAHLSRPLVVDPKAKVRWWVDNRGGEGRARSEAPEGRRGFGPVRVLRTVIP